MNARAARRLSQAIPAKIAATMAAGIERTRLVDWGAGEQGGAGEAGTERQGEDVDLMAHGRSPGKGGHLGGVRQPSRWAGARLRWVSSRRSV